MCARSPPHRAARPDHAVNLPQKCSAQSCSPLSCTAHRPGPGINYDCEVTNATFLITAAEDPGPAMHLQSVRPHNSEARLHREKDRLTPSSLNHLTAADIDPPETATHVQIRATPLSSASDREKDRLTFISTAKDPRDFAAHGSAPLRSTVTQKQTGCLQTLCAIHKQHQLGKP